MSSLSTIKITQIFAEQKISIFKTRDFQRLFHLTNTNTCYKMLERLVAYGILKRATAGTYIVTNASLNDFTLANSLYDPSYVSLESALTYYGVLEQFPFVVSSVTLNKSKTIEYKKTFEYSHIYKNHYFGFTQDKDFLIATPEKALIDMIYLVSKGLRKIDIHGINRKRLDKKTFTAYSHQINSPQFKNYINTHNIL